MAHVDIVCRTKDRPRMLGRAVASVLAQEFSDWRLLLINDGGDPGLVEAALAPHRSSLGGRLHRINNSRSVNMAAAFNQAVAAGEAPLVTCLDDDDTWEPSFLACAVARLAAWKQFPLAGVASSTLEIHEQELPDRPPQELSRKPFFVHAPGPLPIVDLLLRNTVTTNSLLILRSVGDAVGWYDQDLPVLQDWEFLVRICLKGDVLLMPEVLANYHFRPLAKGQVGNSDSEHLHEVFRNFIYNRWLRRAVQGDGQALGLLAGLARMMQGMHGQQASQIIEHACLLRRVRSHITGRA